MRAEKSSMHKKRQSDMKFTSADAKQCRYFRIKEAERLWKKQRSYSQKLSCIADKEG
ncbi:MAG: hypothetical protein LBF71_01050 [Campylobacteraceae bacterium]|nr:hypothetical protein [Campylobacteraceae bacterium]